MLSKSFASIFGGAVIALFGSVAEAGPPQPPSSSAYVSHVSVSPQSVAPAVALRSSPRLLAVASPTRVAQSGAKLFDAPASHGKSSSGSDLPELHAANSHALAPQQRAAYLDIMVKGSLNVSRTKVIARRFMAPDSVADEQIPQIAEKNFRAAADYVLNHTDLPLNLDTAKALNNMLTAGLVPENVRGQSNFRRDPTLFYKWLGSPSAHDLQTHDPVGFAERIHNQISTYDAFPDGNGRTARLMADLALLKGGHAPAFYTEMNDYFKRGAPRAPATRETQVPYFREIVARGDAEAARELGPTPSSAATGKDTRAGPPQVGVAR